MKSARVMWVAAVLLAFGCGKKDAAKPSPPPAAAQPTPQVTSEPAAAVAEPDSPEPDPAVDPQPLEHPASHPAPSFARLPLEKAYKALWCGLKRRQRSGFDAIYAEAQLKDADAFAASWKSEADADPGWASLVMAEAVTEGCDVPGAAVPDDEPEPDPAK